AWALGLGLIAAPGVAPAGDAIPVSRSNPRRTQIVEVVEKVKDAVVNIHSERTVSAAGAEELYGIAAAPSRVNGMGTGIVIDPRGYIITNHHVIDDVQVIRVRLSDGSTYPAKVIARDHDNDLALLKIEPRKPLTMIPLGTAQDLMIGETVLAVGNAFGYEHTVTTGIVSALKRDVTLNKEMAYKSLIQTDTPINPGNSGGPLVNIEGELVGVNVAIRAGAQNIAFAIPVDTMIRVAGDMLSIRKRNGITHGLKLADKIEPNSCPTVRSVAVDRIDPAGPAANAGFQPGDVIVRVGGQRVLTSLDFERALLDRTAGEKVALVVNHEGTEKSLDLVLQAADRAAAPAPDLIWRKLGVKLQPASLDQVTRANSALHGGLLVTEVFADGVAGRAGFQRGDILIGLHQWETLSADNVTYVLNHPELATFSPVRFFIIRNGQVRRGWLPQID
ncbi:MAG TPA: trypsin-like peptidase domain-containing protein, partial [Gemmataceae bacterium]|nr:trypsin-like peptidase domain-containing protein [Gemmataceae bacterium]